MGRAVVARLLGTGSEVRVYLDRDEGSGALANTYRGWGAKVARGALDDEGRLELALEQVHTVVHAGSGLLDSPVTLLDELASVVSAALGAGCRRLIWPSQLGAADPRGDPYLGACADGEGLVQEAPLETVVVRCAVTYGPSDALTALLAGGVRDLDARALHAPLYLDDLAAAVQAADAERGGAGNRHLVVALAGPDVVELALLLDGLASIGVRPGPAGPVPPHLGPLLSRDQPPGPDALGRTGTTIAEGLARIRSAVSVSGDSRVSGPGDPV